LPVFSIDNIAEFSIAVDDALSRSKTALAVLYHSHTWASYVQNSTPINALKELVDGV
jgi:hypothetical protein